MSDEPKEMEAADTAASTLMTRGTDIPAHFKLYRLYMMVPRRVASMLHDGKEVISKEMKVAGSAFEFGKVPAASGMHAVDIFWKNCPHKGPALLSAAGAVLVKKKIKRGDILTEEVPFDEVDGVDG